MGSDIPKVQALPLQPSLVPLSHMIRGLTIFQRPPRPLYLIRLLSTRQA